MALIGALLICLGVMVAVMVVFTSARHPPGILILGGLTAALVVVLISALGPFDCVNSAGDSQAQKTATYSELVLALIAPVLLGIGIGTRVVGTPGQQLLTGVLVGVISGVLLLSLGAAISCGTP